MVDVILRSLDFNAMGSQLEELGITIKEPESGGVLRVESHFGVINTPVTNTTTGKVFAIRMHKEDAALLPDYLVDPIFVCDWRSDDKVAVAKPTYNIDGIDPETGEISAATCYCGEFA